MDGDDHGDGGSDCSYESVASEGGYQPASERGRAGESRIVTSSFCVEVFRHLNWADPTHCGNPRSSNSKDNNAGQGKKQQKGKKGAGLVVDPFAELPSQMLRFDGAMEAWLEELPTPQESEQKMFLPYTELSDAAELYPNLSLLKEGNRRAVVWYFNQNFLLQLWPFFFMPNSADVWVKMLIENSCSIDATHNPLGEINCPKGLKGKDLDSWLKQVFAALQTSKWTPNGEARKLLSSRGLSHAAMAVGDVVQVGSQLYAAGLSGFIKVREAPLILPRRDMGEDNPDSVEESDDDFPCHSPFKSERDTENAKGNSKGNAKGNSKGNDKGKNHKNEKKSQKSEKAEKPQQAKKQQKRKGEAGAKGVPMDRRGLRAELQRLRNEQTK
eukprot:gnl/MRDRNA2_/MRDRNA2_149107_c0_seq1.p1 gnl/MRDRNA2_/MRDRNA2_149107_c0~~gnl/MRDRNA2_/MRDRNA2_149107_c0_seq1.p1  ORF type:complete len:424 (-),score=84.99 gnl/MRDRNA2_/MRDRNA2_149107_c0_seq1:28-1179(-)